MPGFFLRSVAAVRVNGRSATRWGWPSLVASSLVAIAPGPALAGSSVTSTTPGSPVTPSVVDVILYPDDPASFGVEVEVGRPTALDMYLLSDMTGSFYDDLPNARAAVPGLAAELRAISSDLQLGAGTFADKPIYPFGGWYYHAPSNSWYRYNDYVYQNRQSLTSDEAAFQAAVNGMNTVYGGDLPESQLEALLHVALGAQDLGFRSNAFKTVIVQTDAVFHYANDPYRVDAAGNPYPLVDLAGNQGSLTPNNGDRTLDPWEDYPAITMVRDALLQAGIVPIFAVTSNVIGAYQSLVSQWGFGEVVELTSNSSNLAAAVKSGISKALSDVKLFVEDDDFDYVRAIASDESGEKAGVDRDVPSGDRAKFTVRLEDRTSDPRTGDDTIYLTATGYGRTTVHVTVPTPTPPSPPPTVVPTPIPTPTALPTVAPTATPEPEPTATPAPTDVPEPGISLAALGVLVALNLRWRRSR